jgi:transposase
MVHGARMVARKVDPAVAARMYVEQEMSTREIGEKLGVSHATVHRALERAKVTLRPRGSTASLLPDERRAQIRQAYVDGMPIEDMRRELRVSDKTVKRLAEEEGLEPRERGMPRRIDWDQVERLHGQGWPADAIALLVGAGISHVRRILRDLGHGRPPVEMPDGPTLREMYDRLGTVRAVAGEVGLGTPRVQEALLAAGVDTRRALRRKR